MLKIIDTFENELCDKSAVEIIPLKSGKEIKVYKLINVHDLIKFVGFGKYINNKKYNVYMRGQTDLFNGTMTPSLYRGEINISRTYDAYNKRMNLLTTQKGSLKDYPKEKLEPILQHYGVKTNWLDLVDNVWIALWFSCHDVRSKIIESREYIYFSESNADYAYIYLIASDAIKETAKNRGVYKGEATTIVDLRKGTPSIFLRPHAQHAIMMRKQDPRCDDYTDLIVGIAKIPMSIAKKWIGSSELLAVNSLFPAPHFDDGYSFLLKTISFDSKEDAKHIGSIQIVSGE